TDRDIVRGQLTRSADLFCLTVGDVMSSRAHVVTPDLEISEAIAALNGHGVRRAPVVDPAGRLIGIVSLDDLLPALASDLEQLAQLMGTQARHERAPYFAGRARP
ncbi:MAG TPA: CBS domain-containing protein, partial [Steroidobacteraceae bacterium]|nr:CBS domain-containing protein [Steroidobacteraceae bacterium]